MGLLLLNGILLMISDAGLSKTVFKTSSTAGKINFSPIVCGFPDFAISNEILYCKMPANHHHFFVTSKRTFCPV
ncbi:unnamed protein product [Acanthoscelides obtectus]|uniref:Secreted protein n=1 Tax=Acanthoscelides obtectus TaxID=200917 RepID=A0A9P0LKI6_ACAOB|nr:unnamed protein product [Acanthoscelides obtectus]CAK1675642.1 hypothetical protein AOBTE_LOCUS30334 [Acanthoscelides obtectus]